MRVLDTDVLIDLSRGYPPALAWFASLVDPSLVTGYAVFELLAGCDNALAVRRLQRWLRPFRIYWPTSTDCDRALAIFARLTLSHNLGILDALIGECAVGLGVPLCPFNVRHFRAIAGLTTEQQYERV
jgi:predicted nucleic acid-binding protein